MAKKKPVAKKAVKKAKSAAKPAKKAAKPAKKTILKKAAPKAVAKPLKKKVVKKVEKKAVAPIAPPKKAVTKKLKAAAAATPPAAPAKGPAKKPGSTTGARKGAARDSGEMPSSLTKSPTDHEEKKAKGEGLEEDVDGEDVFGDDDEPEEVILTDAEGRRYCRVPDCDQVAQVEGYCRFHYLLFWKKIQIRKRILSEGKLERYIEELTARYPDKYLEMLRKDLRTEKDFMAAIQELELDESSEEGEFEDETQNFIEEMRGVSNEGVREDDEF